MNHNKPLEISDVEWQQIMQVREVREGWGLDSHSGLEEFKSLVYGVKFDFVSGGPGYCGDLYIIQGDALEPPTVLLRKNGTLKIAS
jgi:hypothetical protein